MGRFIVTGGINTAVDLLGFSGLVFVLRMHPVAANLLAFALALCCSYVLNRYWTFAASRHRESTLRSIALFLSCSVLSAALSSSALWALLTVGIPVLTAKLGATAVSMAVNYVLLSRVVFPAALGRPASAAR